MHLVRAGDRYVNLDLVTTASFGGKPEYEEAWITIRLSDGSTAKFREHEARFVFRCLSRMTQDDAVSPARPEPKIAPTGQEIRQDDCPL